MSEIDNTIDDIKLAPVEQDGNDFVDDIGDAFAIPEDNHLHKDEDLVSVHVSEVRHMCKNKPEHSSFLEVQFKGNRKDIFKNPKVDKVKALDYVIVNLDHGKDIGRVVSCGKCADIKAGCHCHSDHFEIDRVATIEDIETLRQNREEERQVVERCRELANQRNLDMKVNDAEWQFDKQRLTIYFTAPTRVDFRDLVKELARNFRTRIELRQINTREETKRLGHGIGPCGLSLCCTTFLHDFVHVTLDHARLQQLTNNVSKLSGFCGRLKCCLMYEYENYEAAFKKFPPIHSLIEMEKGMAKVIKVDIFKNIAQVYMEGQHKYDTLDWEQMEAYIKAGKVFSPKEPVQYDEELRALEA